MERPMKNIAYFEGLVMARMMRSRDANPYRSGSFREIWFEGYDSYGKN